MIKGKALVLAVFTAWPLLYAALLVHAVIFVVLPGFVGARSSTAPLLAPSTLIALLLPTILEFSVLIAGYIGHLLSNDKVSQNTKAVWTVILLLGNVIAMPVYWYIYIWHGPNDE